MNRKQNYPRVVTATFLPPLTSTSSPQDIMYTHTHIVFSTSNFRFPTILPVLFYITSRIAQNKMHNKGKQNKNPTILNLSVQFWGKEKMKSLCSVDSKSKHPVK